MPLFPGTVSLDTSLCLYVFLFHLLSWISWLSIFFPLFFLSHTFLSYFGNNLLGINIYYPSSIFWYFSGPWGSFLLNSQHKVLVPCPSFVCPRPPGLAGWPLMPHPLAWFPWSPLHFLSVSLTYYVRHLVIVSPCLGLQLNFWVKKWLFLLYIH